MTKAMIQHEINVLQAKLREVTRLDMWQRWTWEDEERLKDLKAKLEEFKI